MTMFCEGVQKSKLTYLLQYYRTILKFCSQASIQCTIQHKSSEPSYLSSSLPNLLHSQMHIINELVDVFLVYVRPAGLHLLPKHV